MTSDAVTQAVQASSVIVIARVASVEPGKHAVLTPEALLKGSTSSSAINIAYPEREPENGCRLATLDPGSRVLVFLAGNEGQVYWPSNQQVFLLTGGHAAQQADTGWHDVNEAGLTQLVRSITGQYYVPPANPGEGAGIDWRSTIVPVSVAIAALFGVGLVLMRIWHRIDPS